ncbi:substrate-binding domain-containing protein, partial [Streptomyces sp. MCAF7]
GELDQLTESVAERRVDGVLLVSVHRDDPIPGLLEEFGLPTVLAGRRSPSEPLSHVRSDNLGGAEEAVRHLLGRGRRKVATITGPLDMEVGRSRLQGWRNALREACREPEEVLVARADFTEKSGQRAMRELLRRVP